ncbi:hypothetical protein GCM10009858_04810 [Terrabacter carboxydivorans]|uniref:Uncharacterized protein n=1 Tax=Terrabacter carboxydivorans TaxID=619730 RepID=A0ABN3KRU0_9MICO
MPRSAFSSDALDRLGAAAAGGAALVGAADEVVGVDEGVVDVAEDALVCAAGLAWPGPHEARRTAAGTARRAPDRRRRVGMVRTL